MAVIINMDKPDNCHDCPMCEASRLPFWCMALSEKLPFDRNEIYKSIASDCPLKSTDEMIAEIRDYSNKYTTINVNTKKVVVEALLCIIHKYCDKEQKNE